MGLGAVEMTFGILGFVKEENGVGVTMVANEFDIPTSTAHDHLSTLYDLEYLSKEEGEYHLGLKSFHIGSQAKNSTTIVQVGVESADRVAEQTGENALLVAEEFGSAIYLHRSIGEYSVESRNYLGDKQLLHSNASGKAILANLPEKRVSEIVQKHGLPKQTKNTITDESELFDALSQIKSQEYALSNEETAIGTAGIAAPVVVDNKVYGAIAVTGPTNRIWREEKQNMIINAVLEASNEVELRIIYQ